MEALGQLTGGIAHDFNNMLGVIMGALDLIGRRIRKGDFDIGRFVKSATEAAERAAILTQRLLAFARQQPLAPQPINVNEMIGNMSALLHSTLGEQIRIETVTPHVQSIRFTQPNRPGRGRGSASAKFMGLSNSRAVISKSILSSAPGRW